MQLRKHKGHAETRARSLRYRRPFFYAVVWSALFYLFFLATLVCFVSYLTRPHMFACVMTVSCLGVTLVFYLISLISRRHARCPLCRGTSLLDTGANTHPRCMRLPLLNASHSAIVGIIFTQQYRCIFCGSKFDLLKSSIHDKD